MFSILSCLGVTHDARFVAASIAVCVVGAFCTVVMLSRALECAGSRQRFWTAAAGAVAGTSIWATHFMAMLAYDGGYPVAYDVANTTLSVVVAVLGAWGAFFLAVRSTTAFQVAASGAAFGSGIAAMHFVGMSALDSPAHFAYSAPFVFVAVGLCLMLAAASLLAVRRLVGWLRLTAGAVLIALSVCVLHFTSMAGLDLIPDPAIVSQRLLLMDRAALAIVVAAVSSAVVLAGCAAALMDRLLTDVRGLANASLEALFILSRGRILEVNEQAIALTGLVRSDLLGRDINEIVVRTANKLQEVVMLPGENGVLAPLTGRHVEVEVFSREIEYRGRPCSVIVLRDVTERRRAERAIEHMARHDPLTDLLNRREFDRHLGDLISREGESLALLCLDLDNFKLVNDIGGHAAGDDVLRKVAEILKAAANNSAAFRLGGDEFALIQSGRLQSGAERQLAEKVLRDIEALSASLGLSYFGASAGIAVCRSGKISAEALHSRADAALYAAKEAGRGQLRFFDLTSHQYDDLTDLAMRVQQPLHG
jgi:diguanylate cyclase (GGDEF)-like protein/PAS domain S-box-containing protein